MQVFHFQFKTPLPPLDVIHVIKMKNLFREE